MGVIRVDLIATMNKFIMSSVVSARTYINYEFTDTQLKSFYDVVDDIDKQIETLQLTLEIAFM